MVGQTNPGPKELLFVSAPQQSQPTLYENAIAMHALPELPAIASRDDRRIRRPQANAHPDSQVQIKLGWYRGVLPVDPQLLRAAECGVGRIRAILITCQAQIWKTPHQFLEDDFQFQPGQGRTQAEVDAESK